VLIGGGRFFAREMLKGLEVARSSYKALRQPPRILYQPRDLADPRTAKSAGKIWGGLADHVMCATGAEAARVQGAPASVVGHHLASSLLQPRRGGSSSSSSSNSCCSTSKSGSSSSSGSGSSGAAGAVGSEAGRLSWLKARAAQAAALNAASTNSSSGFVSGNPANFWKRVGSSGSGSSSGDRRPLVALLPGCFEKHLIANLGLYGETRDCFQHHI
jgi:hypothetical protein